MVGRNQEGSPLNCFQINRSDKDQERNIDIKGLDGFLFQKSTIKFLASVPPICLTFYAQHWVNSTSLTSLVTMCKPKILVAKSTNLLQMAPKGKETLIGGGCRCIILDSFCVSFVNLNLSKPIFFKIQTPIVKQKTSF